MFDSKGRYTLSVKLSDFTVWHHTWRKNCVNCAVFIGSSAGLRTVQSSFTQRSAHFTQGMPQFPQFTYRHNDGIISRHSIFQNSFSRWASHDIFIFKYNFLLHILHFLFFFSDNIMANMTSKQQTTTLFLSTIVTRTRRHTELTNLMGNLCSAREHSVQSFVQFFTQLNFTVYLRVWGPLKRTFCRCDRRYSYSFLRCRRVVVPSSSGLSRSPTRNKCSTNETAWHSTTLESSEGECDVAANFWRNWCSAFYGLWNLITLSQDAATVPSPEEV